MGRRGPDYSVEPAPPRFALPIRALWALIAAGFVVRLLLCCTTWGSIDTINYIRFAFAIDQNGLLKSYADNPYYNHPPMPAFLSWVALRIVGRSGFGFAVVYRIPIVLADFGTAMLLRQIVLARGGTARAALAVAAMYAWNPCALLISGYHFNTDPIVAMLSLLAVHLLQDRGRPLLGGLALGLAINVKLIPILLIPPLLLSSTSWRPAIRFVIGLAIMAVPYVPFLILEPAFARNVLGYKSSPDPWGILFLLRKAFPGGIDAKGEVVSPDHPAMLYHRFGAGIVLACSVAWGFIARCLGGRFDRFRIAAVTYTLFLVFAPGFGVQYLALVAGFFYVAAPTRFANLFGVVAGLFLLAVYFFYWDGSFPISSLVDRPFPDQLAAMGLVTWGLLLVFLVAIAPRRSVTITGKMDPAL